MSDPYRLARFVDAQEPVYAAVLAELRAGRKRSHWIWFVFPQLTALGRSPTAKHFGIAGCAEARAYLDHPLLGARLRECARLVAAIEGSSMEKVFGFPDHLKVRSSMTLFAHCAASAADGAEFRAVLDTCYRDYADGAEDPETLRLLSAAAE